MRRAYVVLFVLATVFSMAWYKSVMQRFRVVCYFYIPLVTYNFLLYTRHKWLLRYSMVYHCKALHICCSHYGTQTRWKMSQIFMWNLSCSSANRGDRYLCWTLSSLKKWNIRICKHLKFEERLKNLFTRMIVCLYLGHFSLLKINLTLCNEERSIKLFISHLVFVCLCS